jgi:FkbM family methyltransferase
MQLSRVRYLASRAINKACFRFVPDRMKLPFYYWLHMLEGSCENELKYLYKICKGGKTAIDVGANQGLFSYGMSKHFSKVYAFEVNNDLTNYLDSYNPGNIIVFNNGLSSKTGSATLHIPVRDDNYALIGYGSLSPGNYPNTTEKIVQEITKNVTLCTLDSFNLLDVDFVKIDVEGHELEVLKGGAQTLALCRPIVLVEIKDENIGAIFRFFNELKYQKFKLKDLIGIDGSKENYIFIPVEKIGSHLR